MTEISKIADLTPDERNANLGTERGLRMLADSLRKYGAGRSILVDKKGRVIAGNKTLEQAADIGLEDVIVVQTDGTKLVAVQRVDLDLDDGDRARALAYADNRTSEVGLDWDANQFLVDVGAGLDLSGLFSDTDIDAILAAGIDVYGEGATIGRRDNNSMDRLRSDKYGKGAFIRCEIGEIMTSIPNELYQRVFTIVQAAESQQDGIVGILEASIENWDS